MTTIPTLTTTNWNDEWKRLQVARHKHDDSAAWDARAKSFPTKHGSQSAYVRAFLEKAAIPAGSTILDMGCGTGALATPLAQQGCKVMACDFSRGMLDAMKATQEDLGVKGVTAMQMSWADDWAANGIERKSVDYALASRSIATADLEESLMKLDGTARQRAFITLPTRISPKIDDTLLKAAGLPEQLGADFLYAFNILASHGLNPEVSYIPSERREAFTSREEALKAYGDILRNGFKGVVDEKRLAQAEEQLGRWLGGKLQQGPKGWELPRPRTVLWAFMAWDCSS